MANTSPDNITYPVSTDQVAPLETVFATMATSVQTALVRRAMYSFRWTNSAARTGQTGMRNGDEGYQVDTSTWYDRVSGVWVLRFGDTGWVNSGLSISTTTNWTLNNYQMKRVGSVISLQMLVTYSGPNVVSDGVGNIGDILVGSLPSGWRPGRTIDVSISRRGIAQLFGFVDTGGGFRVSHTSLPSATVLTSGHELTFDGTLMA